MKNLKTLLLAALVAFAATSCDKEPEAVKPTDKGALISLTASMNDFTRATATSFEDGDKVGLYILTDKVYLDNALFTYKAGSLVSSKDYYWYTDESVTADIVAYYPYASSANYGQGTMNFAIDGSSASDLMLAKTTSKPTEESINLPFKHALSKVVVTITNQTDATVTGVVISNLYNNVTVDLAAATATATGQNGSCMAEKVTDNQWEVIVAPQSNATPSLVVTTSDNLRRTYPISEAVTFESGKIFSAPITIAPVEEPEPEPEPEIFDGISFDIADWVVGGELVFEQQGEAEEVVGYKLYVDPGQGWEAYYLYTWLDGNVNPHGAWPGTQITEREEKDGINYYVYTFEEELYGQTINYIVNNGGNGLQSADLSATINQDIYFGLSVDNEGDTEGEGTTTEVIWGVVGTHNGWGATAADTVMTLDETTGLYVALGMVLAELEGDVKIKVRANNTWDSNHNYGVPAAQNGVPVELNTAISLECSAISYDIVVPAAGTYDIYFDLAGSKLYIMTEGQVPVL